MEKSNDLNLDLPEVSNKKEYEPGCLVTFRKMTDEQYKIFAKQLSDNVSYKLDILRNILEDDMLFLEILDIFAGESINIPTRKQLFQYLDRTFMYTYAKSHGFTEDAFNSISKHFGEKLAIVKSRTLRISELLDKEEYASLVKAQNKLKAKRKAKREENKRLKEELSKKKAEEQ